MQITGCTLSDDMRLPLQPQKALCYFFLEELPFKFAKAQKQQNSNTLLKIAEALATSSTVTEPTKKRPVLEQINKINRKSEEADATEPDRLCACRRELTRHKLTVIVWRSRRRERSALFNTFPSGPFHPPPPLPPPDICVSGCRTLNSCVFSVSFSTQRVHVWVMATGWPDTQWQTGPWADRTNAITPHSAHSAAAHNTAISYLSRQLCLRRRIGKQRELAFYHTNTSLGTEGEDKHVTDLTGISTAAGNTGEGKIPHCVFLRQYKANRQPWCSWLGINLVL